MKLLIAAFAILICAQAKAGILFEPMVSYEMGKTNTEFTTAGAGVTGVSEAKADNTAVSYGGRLGLLFSNGFWLAGDYRMSSSGKMKFDSHEDTYNRTTIGADMGMWFGRWNFWAGYNFSDKLDFEQPGGTGKEHVSGYSVKAGLAYLIYHHIAFNLEYGLHTYNKGDQSSADMVYGNNFSQYVNKFTQQSYSAGLSFPF